ncbi:MAG: N-6 DNA methylase [Deltaproteobacteria bacterium]|nr:N-6 DNA methylase [Deltaproteobacteria bacterium]
MKTWIEIAANAMAFAKRWKDAHSEKSQAQLFINEFLRVFGVENPGFVGRFEFKIEIGDKEKGYFDYLWVSKIAIEMNSRGQNLKNAKNQLNNYIQYLPTEKIPDLLLVSDFEKMSLTRRSTGGNWAFKTSDLHKNIKLFAEIAGYSSERVYDSQIEVNVKAAEKMAALHNALEDQGYEGHDLEVYLVRLLFCFFADNTNLFAKHDFLNYVNDSKPDGSDLASRLALLFDALDMPENVKTSRVYPEGSELLKFRYINGSLFSKRLPVGKFNRKIRLILLDCGDFDWSSISPAVFGSMFQGVKNKEDRRQFGMHYTSEENILKLLNPLLLDELWAEFESIKTDPNYLKSFHAKLSKLKFLDPACGCGNFLILAYREIRRLELEVAKFQYQGEARIFRIEEYLKVNVNQFYGVEYLDFPSQIARVCMWLCDHQMNLMAAKHFGGYFQRLPLTIKATIVTGNALRIDWSEVVSNNELSYVIGNPPFIGARNMTPEQKDDMRHVFGEQKGLGNLDYVAAWYKKTFDYIGGADIKCAFVSTNSITQGEQPALLWKPLMEKQKTENRARINFGVPTFKWTNEAKGKAAVHCVIIGFGTKKTNRDLNQYLLDAPTIFVESRRQPLCDVPEIGIGNKPVDGGHYLFLFEEMEEFIKKEPESKKWFRPWIGSYELINGSFRYCLLLKNCPLPELNAMPECVKLRNMVKDFRLSSKSKPTQLLADTPLRFHVENFPSSRYIAIPRVSSENRSYIPMGFVEPEILSSDALHIFPDASLYHFGVLTSSIHMAWVKIICGRLKSDYRYSKDIVYNNFPWPKPSEKQIAAIEGTAGAILEARSGFLEESLANLYDWRGMPEELLKAHRDNDKAVFSAYGFKIKEHTDDAYVKELFDLYQKLTS